ncbi:glycoside hydrolase family 1 protein [Sphingomonas tabacisoli]|uniref:Glycoside hydrolase family 1 protein n=1 Tax=Sphingomonas tabacisoli TaxID=2249466 RepID=A0ABW4I626_9SPHN
MELDRRTLMGSAVALAAAPAFAAKGRAVDPRFPQGFLWGAATAGHQIEGNNVNSDCWLMENVKPTVFVERSGDAANSLELWPVDLDLVKNLGLNTYRFSLEWARIEPEEGLFSVAMLDHYKRIIEGCRERGITPMVTFNHFTTPRWFAGAGGWTDPRSVDLFRRYCDRAAKHLAGGIGYATTLNEPNLAGILQAVLPPQLAEKLVAGERAMSEAAARANGGTKFLAGNALSSDNAEAVQANLLAGHKAGRDAIKAVRPDLPVGVSLAMFDDQAAGKNSIRDAMRAKLYGRWLEAARGDDFVGVQNYERSVWTDKGKLPPPAGAELNYAGSEVYPPSLAGAVRYAYSQAHVPVIVTEHGVGTDNDDLRARLIPAALAELKKAMDDGVPVKGYMHWSLIDNFEWIFGYGPKFGLHSLDRTTFVRTAKASAAIYGAIARRNAL